MYAAPEFFSASVQGRIDAQQSAIAAITVKPNEKRAIRGLKYPGVAMSPSSRVQKRSEREIIDSRGEQNSREVDFYGCQRLPLSRWSCVSTEDFLERNSPTFVFFQL